MSLFLRIFSSLRLTVWLLAFSLLMVFFGTLDQARYGIRYTQERYFEQLLALWRFPNEWPGGDFLGWLHLPIPGGYLIGPLLLINLLAAHFRYFRPRWRNIGIAIIHAGIVFLLIGQLVTQLKQEDYYMWIQEGQSSNYLTSFHRDELVIIDTTEPDTDRVISIPIERVRDAPTTIQHPELPFQVKVAAHFKNAMLVHRPDDPAAPAPPANRGHGASMNLLIRPTPPTYRQDERNATTAIVELLGPNNSLGVWMVSNLFDENVGPQRFEYQDRSYEISLRFERRYLPFEVELKEFSHDRYPGTDIPRNFSSLVHLRDPMRGEDRDALIRMNNPLRHDEFAFFQASFGNNDTSSMFQVVTNPGRWIPYISCILVSLGLLYQFGWGFARFLGKRSRQ